ncbi:MAG TPA: hypothetical protein VGF81_00030 [Solirubrobacteraceae bacterium]
MLQAAARLARGQQPYRDFRLNYPPGQPLALSALYRAVGPSLIAWRVMRVGVDACVSVLAYRLARRATGEPLALAAWLGTAGAMAFPTGAGPNPPAQALSLGAVLLARSRPVGAGALAGAASVFRLEMGAAALTGVVIAAQPEQRSRSAVAALFVAAAGLVPFAVAAPREMLEDTIGFFRIQPMQRLPLPLRFAGPWRPSKVIEFYMPVILFGGFGSWLIATATSRSCDRETVALAPLAFVGAGYLRARIDEFHLVPLAATLPTMLARTAAAERRPGWRTALLASLALIVMHGLGRKAGQALHPPPLAPVPGPAGAGVMTSPDDARELAGVIASVQELTAPAESVFVANPRHDLVRVGNPLLYALLGRPNPTRYDVMQPGVVTTGEVQQEIIGALAGTRVVVRWIHPTACEPEPNGAGRSSGVEILDQYLDAHFRRHSQHGNYEVLTRAISSHGPASRELRGPR